MSIVAIVPTYNERENIEPLVHQLLDLPVGLKVLVVDDNSPDGTGEAADALAAEHPHRLHVLHRPGKLGLGTAHIAGFRQALATGADLVLTMDADFSHHPRYIPSILDRVADGYDVVIGARYIAGGGTQGWTWPRRLLSWGANTFARTMLGLHIHDTTGAFRCYRRQVLESMDLEAIRSSGYSFLIEMAYGIQRAGWRIGEVPIIFEDRRLGQSKISRHEITRALWTVLRLAWGRLRG